MLRKNMKRTTLLLCVICLLTIGSCSKNKIDSVPEKLKDCIITSSEYSRTYDGYPLTEKTFYTYNQGLYVSRVDYGLERPESYETYSVGKNGITWFGHYVSGNTTYIIDELIQLDEKGRIDSLRDSQLKSTYYFRYNTDGFLSEVSNTYFDYNSRQNLTNTYTYSYENQSLEKISFKSIGLSGTVSTIVSNISYTTGELKNDIVSSKIYPYLFSNSRGFTNLTYFLGKRSRNLPDKIVTITTTMANGRSITDTEQFTYEKDTQGNVTRIKILRSYIPIGLLDIKNEEFKFFYQCK